ncbi:TPA: helix-turn-helix transcriptional regulator [Clostridium botulinum]|nr:helix-turn-helix transcriptional regulator [Clostridium botulinum]HDK7226279.1 helix-turn-helix transcriptional regulator [Clostridium botulinum]HDK7273669.1 helix-turn-helix transcriptional regulator [Clostridium botulinum]HDK7307017.1 helix-turn-helix transcriptional regulator [Clostridium botulinum]HDK7314659.1 helix-turn-helix transcriptional regulator [Clostridium botulinum]
MKRNEYKKQLGERIKKRRKELGMTLEEVAREANYSKSFLCDVENGRSAMSTANLSLTAQVLKVPMEYLLYEDDIKNNEDIMVQNFEKDGVNYEILLSKFVFPNGLTYSEMEDKIKMLEKLQEIINNK